MYLNPRPYCYCHIKRLSIQLAPETIKASANYTQLYHYSIKLLWFNFAVGLMLSLIWV